MGKVRESRSEQELRSGEGPRSSVGSLSVFSDLGASAEDLSSAGGRADLRGG